MDIDDEDPESNAAGGSTFSLGEKYLLRNVVVECENTGDITSKKDGAGGIVGYMAQGIVTSCESRGLIESTEGNYVGGIAGQSLSIIRNSSALTAIKGTGYMGGIAGYGTTITDCYAIPTWETTGDRTGSIAGQVERDSETQEARMGVISANFYVNPEVNGIDGVSYKDIAEPVSYEELLKMNSVPYSFSHLKVSYRLEDTDGNINEVGTEEIPYGADLVDLNYPEVPEKSGYYVSWEDTSGQRMDGFRIVNGKYIEIVTVKESSKKYGDTDHPLVYMDGSFERETRIQADILNDPKLPDDPTVIIWKYLAGLLHLEDADKPSQVTYLVEVEDLGSANRGDYKVRLYSPFEEAELYHYEDGRFVKCESLMRGKYIETGTEYISAVYAVKDLTSAKKGERVVFVFLAVLLIIALIILIVVFRVMRRGVRVMKKKAKEAKQKD